MTPSSLASAYPAPGEVVDSWMVEKILGEGGMGCVARAFHVVLQTPVALKFMNPQFMTFPGAVERFINEGKASSLIKSDHVVPVTHAGKTSSGTPYLVMECLDGSDLSVLLQRDGTPGLPVERAVHFVVQVLRGLQAAHAVGIIHRDMKPSNCFVVNNDGEEDFVKILDFGISKVAQPGAASLTQTNSALGTPLYMSPEQARSPRDVDARSDLYSVGVILYELLTGQTPFFSDTGEFTEILYKLFTAEPPPVQRTRPDLPDALAAAVHKALARDVAARFQSALEMAEALEPFAGERTKPVLARMRGFKAPVRKSNAPDALPPSMVAFSQIEARPHTDLMANRPRLGGPKVPSFTAAMPNAPGRVAATPSAPALPREGDDVAAATTQYDSARAAAPPKEPEQPAPRPTPQGRRSPLVFVAVGFAALAIAGGAFVATRAKEKDIGKHEPAPANSPSSTTGLVATQAPPAAPDVPLATTAASASPVVPKAPSAAPSASVAPVAPVAKTAPPAPRPTPTKIPGLDNGIQN